jgi:hypothetical protein
MIPAISVILGLLSIVLLRLGLILVVGRAVERLNSTERKR